MFVKERVISQVVGEHGKHPISTEVVFNIHKYVNS